MTTFFVPGIPAPQGSKRHLGNGILVESSKRVKPWRTDVREAARHLFDAPLDGPVLVVLGFYLPRPKGHYRTGANAHLLRDTAPRRPTTRPDVDKLVRAVLDALTGIAWNDDSQVVDLETRKWYAADQGPGVGINIRPQIEGWT